MLIGLGGNFASYGIYDKLVEGNLSPGLNDRLETGDTTRDTESRLEVYERTAEEFEGINKQRIWDSLM